MREEIGTTEDRETIPSFDLHTRLFIYLSCQKVTNACWMSNNARRRQTVPRPSASPFGRLFRRQRPDDGHYDSSIPTSAVHTVSPPYRAHKQGINNGESYGLWMGGGCLSAPAKRGCMSHSLGFTRPGRVANRLLPNTSQHKPRHVLSGPKV
jgi:hypothetical protein